MNEDATAPTFAQLVDWVDGKLDATQAARVQAAVDAAIARGDEALAATLAWLRAFRTQADETVLVPPPDAARARVMRAFEDFMRRRSNTSTQPGGLLRRILAPLVRATGPGLAVEGARGAAIQARRRQMTFECELADIVLNVQPRDGTHRLSGQVLPRVALDVAGLIVELLRLGGERVPPERSETEALAGLTRADDMGEFTFDAVAPGRYVLVLVAEALEISVAPFEVA
jgi:hypothetical protein